MSNITVSLINFIENSVDLKKYTYQIISKDNLTFNPKEYYVSLNVSNANCLLVCKRFRDKNYTFVVGRQLLKYLSFRKNDNININEIPIKCVKILLKNLDIESDSKLFEGSIFEGIYSKNSFYIFDCYYFNGLQYTDMNYYDKMVDVRNFFEKKNIKNLDIKLYIFNKII